jgi:hypothetical protein
MDEVQASAVMSQADYARYRRCSPAYVSQLKARGLLVMQGDMVDVLATDREIGAPESPNLTESFSAAPSTDLAKAQLKLIEAQASLTELKLKERAGELVEAAGVAQKVSDVVAPLFDRLEALPMAVADKLTRLTTEREIAAVISAAIEDVRAAFAQDIERSFAEGMPPDVVQEPAGEPDDDRRDGGGRGGEAPAAPDAERVGG